jgi:hypothetical protein
LGETKVQVPPPVGVELALLGRVSGEFHPVCTEKSAPNQWGCSLAALSVIDAA